MTDTITTDYPEQAATITTRFLAFHDANPQVYERLVAMTRELKARGHTRVGIGMLFEVMRWEHAITTADPLSDLKLNNVYRSRYARLIMAREYDLDGIFETRRLPSTETGTA